MIEYKVIYTNRAAANISDIRNYIGGVLENPLSALRIVEGIISVCDSLNYAPKRSEVKMISRGRELRYVHSGNYAVVYYVDDDATAVTIFAVVYSRRDIAGELGEE